MSPAKRRALLNLLWAALICALMGMVLYGCAHSPLRSALPPAADLPGPAPKDVASANDQAAEARSQIAFWRARLAVATEETARLASEARKHWLDTACRWVMGLCLAGLLGNVGLFAASFVWPWFARLRYVALAGAGACLALFILAWYLPAIIHIVALIAFVGAVLSGLYVVTHFHGFLGKIERASGLEVDPQGQLGTEALIRKPTTKAVKH